MDEDVLYIVPDAEMKFGPQLMQMTVYGLCADSPLPKPTPVETCKVCGRHKSEHNHDREGVYWCPDNVSVRASFPIKKKEGRK